MKISSHSAPKYRNLSAPGDDISLIFPGLIGVFDGATSAMIDGQSPGRIAAEAAASAIVDLTVSSRILDMDIASICASMRERMIAKSQTIPPEIYMATTIAAVAFGKDEIRLIVVGDSGIRVNGQRIYRHLKKIDDVTTNARVKCFNILANKIKEDDKDQIEMLARRTAYIGLAKASREDILTSREVEQILSTLDDASIAENDRVAVEGYLLAGLQNQKILANRPDLPLSYSVLCRNEIMLDDVIDVRLPLDEVESLEIYSDGYFTMPEHEITIEAWEQEFMVAEGRDFHKIADCKSIKGSTSTEFADDRTLIIAEMQ